MSAGNDLVFPVWSAAKAAGVDYGWALLFVTSHALVAEGVIEAIIRFHGGAAFEAFRDAIVASVAAGDLRVERWGWGALSDA